MYKFSFSHGSWILEGEFLVNKWVNEVRWQDKGQFLVELSTWDMWHKIWELWEKKTQKNPPDNYVHWDFSTEQLTIIFNNHYIIKIINCNKNIFTKKRRQTGEHVRYVVAVQRWPNNLVRKQTQPNRIRKQMQAGLV